MNFLEVECFDSRDMVVVFMELINESRDGFPTPKKIGMIHVFGV